MDRRVPAFGFLGGLGISLATLPHISVLIILMVGVASDIPKTPLYILFAADKVLGIWLFFTFFSARMDRVFKKKGWKHVVNSSILDHPNLIVCSIALLADTMLEYALLQTVSSSSSSLVWAFLVMSCCKVLAAPIQGFISDISSQKMSLIFAMLFAFFALWIAEPSLNSLLMRGSAYVAPILGISDVTEQSRIVLALAIKGLLGNILPVAMGAVGTVVYFEALKNKRT